MIPSLQRESQPLPSRKPFLERILSPLRRSISEAPPLQSFKRLPIGAQETYSNLPHIDIVAKPFSPETLAQDQRVFEKVAKVLKEEGATNRWFLSLAHTHFDMQEGQTLLERTDEERGHQEIDRVEVSSLPEEANLMPTQFRFHDSKDKVSTMITCSQCCMLNTNGYHKAYHIENN